MHSFSTPFYPPQPKKDYFLQGKIYNYRKYILTHWGLDMEMKSFPSIISSPQDTRPPP